MDELEKIKNENIALHNTIAELKEKIKKLEEDYEGLYSMYETTCKEFNASKKAYYAEIE